jgi:hypothetical protein
MDNINEMTDKLLEVPEEIKTKGELLEHTTKG